MPTAPSSAGHAGPGPAPPAFCRPAAYAAPALLCFASLLVALVLGAMPARSGPVAAVFPPWWGAARSLARAAEAGPVVRFGAAGFVVVVAADAAGRTRLRQSGALLLLNPLAGGCAAAVPPA